jgi:hypothetical protein
MVGCGSESPERTAARADAAESGMNLKPQCTVVVVVQVQERANARDVARPSSLPQAAKLPTGPGVQSYVRDSEPAH